MTSPGTAARPRVRPLRGPRSPSGARRSHGRPDRRRARPRPRPARRRPTGLLFRAALNALAAGTRSALEPRGSQGHRRRRFGQRPLQPRPGPGTGRWPLQAPNVAHSCGRRSVSNTCVRPGGPARCPGCRPTDPRRRPVAAACRTGRRPPGGDHSSRAPGAVTGEENTMVPVSCTGLRPYRVQNVRPAEGRRG